MTKQEIRKALERLLDKLRAYECKNVSIDEELLITFIDLMSDYENEIDRLKAQIAVYEGWVK